MELIFADKELAKAVNSKRLLNKRLGRKCADRVRQRVFELFAAESLEVASTLTSLGLQSGGNGHESDCHFTVALGSTHCLVIEAIAEAVSTEPVAGDVGTASVVSDGKATRMNLADVTKIRILAIEETNGR